MQPWLNYFDVALNEAATRLDGRWPNHVVKWGNHMLDRMVDRNISLQDVVATFLQGHHSDGPALSSFYAKHNGVKVVAYEEAQGIRLRSCWREGSNANADIAWNLSGENKVMRVLGVQQLPCLSFRGPLGPS